MRGIKGIVKKVETCKNRIAAERDKLRELIGDIEDIEQSSTEAVHDLDVAIDTLSQYL